MAWEDFFSGAEVDSIICGVPLDAEEEVETPAQFHNYCIPCFLLVCGMCIEQPGVNAFGQRCTCDHTYNYARVAEQQQHSPPYGGAEG